MLLQRNQLDIHMLPPKIKAQLLRKCNNRAHSTSYLTGGLQTCAYDPLHYGVLASDASSLYHIEQEASRCCAWNNIPQTTKIPNCRNSWGFSIRYKGLPECPSICERCVYCSCCTYTLSHLRLSQGMSQTADNYYSPGLLDCSLWCYQQKREIYLFL